MEGYWKQRAEAFSWGALFGRFFVETIHRPDDWDVKEGCPTEYFDPTWSGQGMGGAWTTVEDFPGFGSSHGLYYSVAVFKSTVHAAVTEEVLATVWWYTMEGYVRFEWFGNRVAFAVTEGKIYCEEHDDNPFGELVKALRKEVGVE